MAKEILADAKIEYTLVNADEEPKLARKFKVMQAPTLVNITGGEKNKVQGVSEIIKFIEENK